jgi:hypothetical protein
MPGYSTLAVVVAAAVVVVVADVGEIVTESQSSRRSNGRGVGPRRWVPELELVLEPEPEPELELEVVPKATKRAWEGWR